MKKISDPRAKECALPNSCQPEMTQQRGVIFYIRGAGHLERLIVAAMTLRQHYEGRVAILVEGSFFPILSRLGEYLDIQVVHLEESGHPPYSAKVACLKYTPFAVTLFLDADVIVRTSVVPYFEILGNNDFVFTHFPYPFYGVSVKIENWRKLRLTENSLVDQALTAPPINLGSFAYRKDAEFLASWEQLATRAGNAGAHIPDEICAQVYLPRLKYSLAGVEWGVCGMTEPSSPTDKIIHFLGRSHEGAYPQVGLYQQYLQEAMSGFPDLFEACLEPPTKLAPTVREIRKRAAPVGKPNLLYTVAFDPPNGRLHRTMAKMLVSSLRRTYFEGDILVFRNSDSPLFPSGRPHVREIYIPFDGEGRDLAKYAYEFKFLAADFISSTEYQKIFFADADCLAVNNITSLLDSGTGIQFSIEYGFNLASSQFRGHLQKVDEKILSARPGSNSGVWCVPGEEYQSLMRQWQAIYHSPKQEGAFHGDQPAWNRLLVDTHLDTDAFAEDDLMYPLVNHPDPVAWSKAKLLHFFSGTPATKVEAMFTAYMRTFYADAAPFIVDFLEF